MLNYIKLISERYITMMKLIYLNQNLKVKIIIDITIIFKSIELENILMLKQLDMSISEIKSYLNNPNVNDFVNIADDKILK